MKRLLLFTVSLSLSQLIFAQDFHYWSDQFGMKASSLGGAVTSGIDDHSMVYYNPAALFMIEKPSLSFTINAYEYQQYKQKNALGPMQDLHNSEFATLPNLMAGVYSPKKHPNLRFGYTVLSTNNYENKSDILYRGDYEAVASTAGTEHFIGTYTHDFSNHEYWAGLGIGYRLNPFINIGLTHMGIYKSTKYANLYEFTAQPEDPSTGEISQLRSDINFSYYDIKAIFKPSLQLNFPKVKLGIAYTTPSINLYGRGNFYRELDIVNLNDVLYTDVSWIDRAHKVKIKHQSRGSIAYGLSFALSKKIWTHLAAESFFKQPYYLIYDNKTQPSTYPNYFSDSLTNIVFGNQNFLSYGERYKALTNIAIGFDIFIDSSISIQFGMRTDFNYNGNKLYSMERQVIESTKYDRLIGSIGSRYNFKNGREFSLCFEFGWALPRTSYQNFDFTTPNETRNGLLGDPGVASTEHAYSYRLMVGVKLGKD